VLDKLLQEYPETEEKSYLIQGLRDGFHTGLSAIPDVSLECKNNMSCQNNLDATRQLIQYEQERGYVIGPYKNPPFPIHRINPISIAEGKYSKKKRLVVDLSVPHDSGDSLNDLIDKELFSLTYVKLDHAISIIRNMGPGTILNKTDIKDAFKLIPIHPSLWHLHGVKVDTDMYFFTRLVFGSRSSPKIFDTLAKAITWILENVFNISPVLHLLDDFLVLSPPGTDGGQVKSIMLHVFAILGIPLSPQKTVGPSECLEYLGIILDTNAMQARLPPDKLCRIRHMLDKFLHLTKCKKRDLLSLLGHLNYASSVIPPGRSFISRLIQASKTVSKLHYFVYLNSEAKQDIQMWKVLLQNWNGISMFIDPLCTPAPDMELYTDASAKGFSGYFHGKWFAAPWPDSVDIQPGEALSMSFCELYPIVTSAILWGHAWAGKRILFHCDNMGTVWAINKGRSKSPHIMNLMRRLVLVAAHHSFSYSSEHVPGVYNLIADSLSRFQMDRFRELAPEADRNPHVVPADIMF
jgi:hypothetical protein